ncbi:MAG TPA: HAMP domain-containing sensor histidine kinase [Myxococcales bacterium]|nr:HAMP domain-containing sensor histidine kinase [Myxococcales bacterium]
MTDPGPAVALPAYEAELETNQRSAVRGGALVAAPLLLAFVALDRVTAPAHFWLLLSVRLVAAGGLLAVARAARSRIAPVSLAACAVVLLCGTIEAGVFCTGGARSAYLTSNIAVLAGVGILVPLTVRQSIALQMLGLTVALVPLLFVVTAADALAFATSASYLVAIAIVAAAGARLQDVLRRREHRARLEIAKQMGLINLGTLAGGLAHELATPLTWVSTELDSLDSDRLPEPARERIRSARSGAARMRSVLSAMRQGARFATTELREVMLRHELDQALMLVAQRVRAAGVTVTREYEPDVPLVSCQPTLLGQVLVNLLINALDAMAGQPDGRLTLRVRFVSEHALVEVEDSGPGVPKEMRARIFEPYFSTKGERGNGLGLWISSQIARSHGGDLVASPGSVGALFRLSLPVEANLSTPPSARPLRSN